MDFQTGLRARLLADSTVSGLVGTRVYWMQRPQNSGLPAIVLQTISDPRPDHLKGFDGARETRVQCDCWAEGYGAALALGRSAIAALKSPQTISEKRFGNARVDAMRDLSETAAGGETIHRQSVDFLIWHVGD